MRRLALVCCAGLVVLMAARRAEACSCKPERPPAEALSRADVVFEGRAGTASFDEDFQRVPFDVARVYKGDPGAEVTVWTKRSGAACGRFYQPGDRYLVYAWVSEDKIWDGLCSRTRLLDDARVDLGVLGPGQKPHPHPPRETMPAEPAEAHEPSSAPAPAAEVSSPPVEPSPTTPDSRGCMGSIAADAPDSSFGWQWLGLALLGLRARPRPRPTWRR